MNKQRIFTALLTLLISGLSLLVICTAPIAQAWSHSPLPTPAMLYSPLPTPKPIPPSGSSPEAQKALAYVAAREGIAIHNLAIVNEFRREAPLLKRTFQAITVLDLKSGHFFPVLVDHYSGQVEAKVSRFSLRWIRLVI